MRSSSALIFEIVQEALAPESFRSTYEYDQHLEGLNPDQAGWTFATSLFLASVSQNLVEKHWLLTHGLNEEQPAFAAFLQTALRRELAPLRFLETLWSSSVPTSLKSISTSAGRLAKQIAVRVAKADDPAYRMFAIRTVQVMAELSSFEERLLPQRTSTDEILKRRLSSLNVSAGWTETRPAPDEALLPASVFRAFDLMDEIFQLDYRLDSGMKRDLNSQERLYEGAGLGVQTSYATILMLLERLQLPLHAHLIDLGSGYGRVGLVAGLWRQDLRFTGYEYVPHRVDVSQAAAERAGLRDRVRFVQQDLADLAFVIPEADVYYMFDPFCAETYRRVLLRLMDVGRGRPVVVVTKGNAGSWFSQSVADEGWCHPETYDDGNLLLFRSR